MSRPVSGGLHEHNCCPCSVACNIVAFGGWKSSIYGDLYAQGGDAVAFYTRKKVITERWFGAEAPKDGWI
jgi:acyl-CoA reductase-like NAD-dependent aldehyde dehydrogenase